MKVLVRKDSATVIPIDCGEGEEGEARLKKLVAQHGAGVTNEDGSPIVLQAAKEIKDETRPFDEWKNDELREYLDARNIDYPSDAVKDDLVRLVKSAARKEAKAAKNSGEV